MQLEIPGLETHRNEPDYPRIVGLSGKAGSGKTTVSDIIVSDYGYEKASFAEVLREALYLLDPSIFGPTGETWKYKDLIAGYGYDLVKKSYPEVRRLLQVLGTDIGRKLLDQDVWVDAAIRKLHPDKKYVFDDVRFLNEAAAIRTLGILIRIERPDRIRDGLTGEAALHESETALDKYQHFSYTIQNDLSLNDLTEDVRTIMELSRA